MQMIYTEFFIIKVHKGDDQRDVTVFEALDELFNGGGRHGGGVNKLNSN